MKYEIIIENNYLPCLMQAQLLIFIIPLLFTIARQNKRRITNRAKAGFLFACLSNSSFYYYFSLCSILAIVCPHGNDKGRAQRKNKQIEQKHGCFCLSKEACLRQVHHLFTVPSQVG
jgi:hypothetical protein